jgi:hypothetical protein
MVEKPTQDNAQLRLAYRIPFKPQGNGRLGLPTLSWHWFDPNTGRLEQVQYIPPKPWVLSGGWRVTLGGLGSLLLLAGLWRIGRFVRHYLRRWQAKQQVWRALRQNAEPQVVRRALYGCAVAHGWPTNFSMGRWLQQWEQQYGENLHLRAALLYHEASFWTR